MPGSSPEVALGPPSALLTAVAATSVVALLAALVWHTRWPNAVDTEMMRWQEAVRIQGDGIATAIVDAVGPLVVLAVLGSAALAWRARRWDAVVLALVATPGALVIELLLKQVVYRQRPEGTDLLYPSGHVAVATAAAVTAVLVLRTTLAPPRKTVHVAWLVGWLVAVIIAAARLVQTVHYVTDVVGGAAVGLAVTCWSALAITTGGQSGLLMASRSRPSGTTRHLPAGCDERPPRDPPGTS